MNNSCIKGGFVIRRSDGYSEKDIINDFQNNIEININGNSSTQEQMLNELYYNNPYLEKKQNNVYNNQRPNNRIVNSNIENNEMPTQLEPGQVDPLEFFGNSLKGLF